MIFEGKPLKKGFLFLYRSVRKQDGLSAQGQRSERARADTAGIEQVHGARKLCGTNRFPCGERLTDRLMGMPEQYDVRPKRRGVCDQRTDTALDTVQVSVRQEKLVSLKGQRLLVGCVPAAKPIAISAHHEQCRAARIQPFRVAQAVSQKKDRIGISHLSCKCLVHRRRATVRIRKNQKFQSNPPQKYYNIVYHKNAVLSTRVQKEFAKCGDRRRFFSYTAFESSVWKGDALMQIDQRMLNRLLTMNDDQLGEIIKTIATEAGIDPAMLGLNPDNIQSIRQALGSATEADLQQLNAVYDTYKQNKRGR